MLLFPSSAEYGITWDRVDSCGNALISLIAIDSNRSQHKKSSFLYLICLAFFILYFLPFLQSLSFPQLLSSKTYLYFYFLAKILQFLLQYSCLLSFYMMINYHRTLLLNNDLHLIFNRIVYHRTTLFSTDSDSVYRL